MKARHNFSPKVCYATAGMVRTINPFNTVKGNAAALSALLFRTSAKTLQFAEVDKRHRAS